jgi:hypothetical protein
MFRKGRVGEARTPAERSVRVKLGRCLRKLRSAVYLMPPAHAAALNGTARLLRAMSPARLSKLAQAVEDLKEVVKKFGK